MIESLLIIILFLLLLISFVLYRKNKNENGRLKEYMRDLISKKQSLSTKYGKMTEQFMPFISKYPYDEHNFRFIGSPIDGVQFEDDKIIFVEFKTSESRLTARQKEIKEIIRKGRVEFEEFRI